MKRSITAALLACALWLTGTLARAEPFKDGETVCFLGDSITAGGRYQGIIADYYLTRFPDRTIRFVNAGRAGDSAGGALARLREDVIDQRPTSVAIMFGMNDVNRGAYVANPDDNKRNAQRRALDGYRANMETLVRRIRVEVGDPRLFFLTPSPFDQTVVVEKENNQPGCNDGLARCASFVRELAARNDGIAIDLHGPMTALNLERQKRDPKWTIIGADRVHPGPAGHLMMAWLFLHTQAVPSTVSKVTVDAAACRATECVNATVTATEKTDGGATFTILARALPFPIEPAARSALEFLPIEKELNQEILSVIGLADGSYDLKIDGAIVGRYPGRDLARGINLAFNEATPQARQAQTVAKHNAERRDAEATACRLMNTRRWMRDHYRVDPDDPAAVQAHYDSFADKSEYSAAMALYYIKNWARHGEYRQRATDEERLARAARVPVPHRYAVVPANQS